MSLSQDDSNLICRAFALDGAPQCLKYPGCGSFAADENDRQPAEKRP